MNRIREHLAEQLAKKVDTHGLVVWQDDAAEYREVAPTVVPNGVPVETYNGSWYELRRCIEDRISGEQPPALVVYAPAAPPIEDPLAEVRAGGAEFKLLLRTLLRQSLGGQLTETRIAEIAARARTLVEAEAAVSGGGDADVRLIAALGTVDPTQLLLRILGGAYDERLDADGWRAVGELAQRTVGARLEKGAASDDARDELFGQLLLTALATLDGLPDALAGAAGTVTADQRRRALETLRLLEIDPATRGAYHRLADNADKRYDLAGALSWHDGWSELSGTGAVEHLAFRTALDRHLCSNHSGARDLARARLANSLWAREVTDEPTAWGARWRALDALAGLHLEIDASPPPAGGTSSQLEWYSEQGWQVDRAHRRLELARSDLAAFGDLDAPLTAARGAYDNWLDQTITRFTTAAAGGIDPGDLVRQGDIHDRFVGDPEKPTAYVWVDALRYELGADLADALRRIAPVVELHAAVAAAPTITPVGMANLTPGAATRLGVTVDGGGKLIVTISGSEIKTVAHRRALLALRHGNVPDLDLNEAAQQSDKALAKHVEHATLLLLRSTEVDATGESGMLAVAWTQFENIKSVLTSVVARLGQAGIRRFVITADHGFIALSQGLTPARTIPAPSGGIGDLHRRAWTGRGADTNAAVLRLSLSATGASSDLDLLVPRGLGVFAAGGGRQFFHGGLSPQELVVPVIVVETESAPEPQKLTVHIAVASGRIATGAFAASVVFEGNLFTNDLTLRVAPVGPDGSVVARIIAGDGYDPDGDVIALTAGQESNLRFQVTRNLAKDDIVTIRVLDARTSRELAKLPVPVAAPIAVEDDLG